MTQREEFEAWFVKAYHPASLLPIENGCYLNLGAGMAWDAWQAAKAAQPAHAHAIDTSPERVEKQAGNVQVSGWQPTDAAMAALRRFEETCADGEGYDVPKDTMKQLALIGLVAHLSGGRYVITDFGQSMLSAAPSTKEQSND